MRSIRSSFAWSLMFGEINMIPNLDKVIVQEIDNGINWLLTFYFKGQIIDQINLESVRGTCINEEVMKLQVINEDEDNIGTVLDRLQNAYDVNYIDFMVP